ncbi:MAG: hypothetical protein E5V24_23345, partial [Mesorhizobium sp.]
MSSDRVCCTGECAVAEAGQVAPEMLFLKPFRDKRRDSRSHQLAKGGAEQAPRATGTASGNR